MPELQDNLVKDYFIDGSEDQEIRIQIEAMYEAESRCSKGPLVRVIEQPPQGWVQLIVEQLSVLL